MRAEGEDEYSDALEICCVLREIVSPGREVESVRIEATEGTVVVQVRSR